MLGGRWDGVWMLGCGWPGDTLLTTHRVKKCLLKPALSLDICTHWIFQQPTSTSTNSWTLWKSILVRIMRPSLCLFESRWYKESNQKAKHELGSLVVCIEICTSSGVGTGLLRQPPKTEGRDKVISGNKSSFRSFTFICIWLHLHITSGPWRWRW